MNTQKLSIEEQIENLILSKCQPGQTASLKTPVKAGGDTITEILTTQEGRPKFAVDGGRGQFDELSLNCGWPAKTLKQVFSQLSGE